MPGYSTALASDAALLGAVKALIERMKVRGPGIPGRFYTAASCLEDDSEIDTRCWVEIATYYKDVGSSKALTEVEQYLIGIFRRFQLQGTKDPTKRDDYGRAIARHTLLSTLSKYDWTPASVDDVLTSLTLLPLDECRKTLRLVELGSYLMWSTFSDTAPDPFDPRKPHIELIDDLGLELASGLDFFLFWYQIPDPIELHLPSCADAYGGEELFFPFRPGGRTFPITKQGKLSGRPERVHKLITGENLKGQVEAIP